jgi:L-ascorbate metabolism protein UlaG (beta-lactamase superfamily)
MRDGPGVGATRPERETRVRWIGHATVSIETARRRVLTDPVLRNRIGPVRRRAGRAPTELDPPDVVLISHLHHDHLDLQSMRLLPRDVTVIVPTGAGPLVRSEAFVDVRELSAGHRTTVGDLAIEAVPARHGGRRPPFGPTAAALGYVIGGDHRIYFAGDTDLFPGMVDIGPELDLAILPVGGWGPTLRGGHMDPQRAAEALALLRPRYAIAVHWGTFWPAGLGLVRHDRFFGPGAAFAREAGATAPGVVVVPLRHEDELVLGQTGGATVRPADPGTP